MLSNIQTVSKSFVVMVTFSTLISTAYSQEGRRGSERSERGDRRDRIESPRPGAPGPGGRDRDRDGIPDRLEPTQRYTEVDFTLAGQSLYSPVACLEPIGNWSTSERSGWDFRHHGGGYVDFDVHPNCTSFRYCEGTDFETPARPSDCGSTSSAIRGDSKTVTLTAEKTVSAALISAEIETEKVCNLVELPEATCKDSARRKLFAADGKAYSERVDQDGNVLSRELQRFTRNLWGFDLLQVRPQVWNFTYPTRELQRFETEISASILPIDFPKAYYFSATINHKEGSQAQLSFNSKYFSHSARLVSQTRDKQAFEVSSTLQPITAPNVAVAFDPATCNLTINDRSMKELSELDPRNAATYTVTVYANWKRNFGDEKLGQIISGNGQKTVTNDSNAETLSINLAPEFLAHPKFKKEKFDAGGKDWEVYVEVTTQRTNKYVQKSPSSVSVTKFAIAKKKVLKDVEQGFTKSDRYR
jgi:hypothetical protein